MSSAASVTTDSDVVKNNLDPKEIINKITKKIESPKNKLVK